MRTSRLDPVVRGALVGAVGPSHVLDTDDLVAGYSVDWMGRFHGRARAVVRPASTAEVAAVVAICGRHGLALVPQGGNTGLVGGSVPLHGEIVLSLRRLDTLEPVDVRAAQLTAGAGATLEDVQHHAAAAGLQFAVDLAARSSATIGGMVATNAGGIHVVRYGPMRAQLLGVEAVLADGSIVSHLNGLMKDNTGYDLAGLICGSEGTLAVVTRARLRLVPRHAHRVTVALGCTSMTHAVDVVQRLRSSIEGLEAVEMMRADGVALVASHRGVPVPAVFRHAVSLLIDVAAHHDPTDDIAAAIGAVDPGLIADVAVAATAAQTRELWLFRESHTEAINLHGPPVKLDVTLPAGSLAVFCDDVENRIRRVMPGSRTVLFGHLGDGNVHVNVVGAAADPATAEAVEEAVLSLVAEHRGSISAEHGIGALKRAWLHLSRSESEIAAFRAIKRALDPGAILNPHVLLPEPGSP